MFHGLATAKFSTLLKRFLGVNLTASCIGSKKIVTHKNSATAIPGRVRMRGQRSSLLLYSSISLYLLNEPLTLKTL